MGHGHSEPDHEQVEIKTVYEAPKVDAEREALEKEQEAVKKLMAWGETINRRLLKMKSWPEQVKDKLPERISIHLGKRIWDMEVTRDVKNKVVENLPYILFVGSSVSYALGMLFMSWVRGSGIFDSRDTRFGSGIYRSAVVWILVMMDAIFIAILAGTTRLYALVYTELKRLEQKIPGAIDSFRNECQKFQTEADEEVFLKAAHALRTLFNMLQKAKDSVNETMNMIHDKMSSKKMKCFCSALVKKFDSADDEAMHRVQSGFTTMYTDEEMAEVAVQKEQCIFDKIMTWEEKALLPMEKKVALHILSILKKDAKMSFEIAIALESFLAVWTTTHTIQLLCFG